MSLLNIDCRRVPEDAEAIFWRAPDGWQIRTLRLTPVDRPKGSLLFASGRGDFFEKYIESLEYWRRSGWRVFAFDWRGQGGSGRLSADPLLGHVSDFNIWLDDLEGLIADWRAKDVPGPHVIVGHSMGGHIALRLAVERGIAANAMVLSSPMIGFLAPVPEDWSRRIAAWQVRRGKGEMFAWGQTAWPLFPTFRQWRLTSDPERYADERWWLAHHPELTLGGASWGWVDAAYRSATALLAPGGLERLTLPVLMAASNEDRVTDTPAAIAAVSRLPNGRVLLLKGAHELLREKDDLRLPMLSGIDAFLAEC